MGKIDIAGLKVDAITKQAFLDDLLIRIKAGQKTFAITPYSEFLYHGFKEPELLDIFNSADYSLADGIGLFWAKKYLELPLSAKGYWGKITQAAWQQFYSLAALIFRPSWIRSALPEKIVGADLIWDLASFVSDNNLSVFLLGGYGDTPKIASDKLILKYPKLSIAGYSNKNPEDPSLLEEINNTSPDLLFVAYGPVRQEKWIDENLPKLRVKFAIGIGGSFDYIAGIKSEPPKFIRYTGFEWLYRLITQPKRYQRIFNATFGLMSGMWHYKVFSNLPLRPNTVIVILDRLNKVLICQRDPKNFHVDIITTKESLKRKNYWQLPQGGVDKDEKLVDAARREAFEETGIKNLDFIEVSKQSNTYIWNNALRKFWHNRQHANIGQRQNVVYFRFLGPDDGVKVDEHEFVNYQWANISELNKIVHPERAGIIKIVQEDLKQMAEKAII
jgi:N-acetylglucosaminyldiphosphoundecaprenol N-acetyl-beta-D-mannosaminyltransferase